MSTLKVDTILKRTGTGTITLGQSGDTVTLGTGASQSGFGMSNLAPFFSARTTANQQLTTSTMTKIQFATEIADSGSVYDNSSNYRFTPGVVGKYFIGANVTIKDTGDGSKFQMAIYENGSNMNSGQASFMIRNGANDNLTVGGHWLLDVDSTSDYYEIYCLHNKGSTQELRGDFFNNFFGFKIG